MKIRIPAINWLTALADTIANAEDGDEIYVLSENAAELGSRAQKRMCPDKKLTFIVEKETEE